MDEAFVCIPSALERIACSGGFAVFFRMGSDAFRNQTGEYFPALNYPDKSLETRIKIEAEREHVNRLKDVFSEAGQWRLAGLIYAANKARISGEAH